MYYKISCLKPIQGCRLDVHLLGSSDVVIN